MTLALQVVSTVFFALGMCALVSSWFLLLDQAKDIHADKCRRHLFGCSRDGDPKEHDEDCAECAEKGAR